MKQLPPRITLGTKPSVEDGSAEKLKDAVEKVIKDGSLLTWYRFGDYQHKDDDILGRYTFVTMTLIAITDTEDKYNGVKAVLTKYGFKETAPGWIPSFELNVN